MAVLYLAQQTKLFGDTWRAPIFLEVLLEIVNILANRWQ